jgi:hypothetical protein
MSAILEEGIGFGGNDNESSSESPTIILKKGKVELKIKNAAAVVKKIDEMYPGDNSYTGWNTNWNKRIRDLNDREKAKQIRWMEAAKNWFKEEIFGGLNDFEVVVSNNEKSGPDDVVLKNTPPISVKYNEETHTLSTPSGELTPEYVESLSSVVKKTTPAPNFTNKNAYELRTDILSMALDWVRYKGEVQHATGPFAAATDEDVLSTAQKFYKFVENRR